MSDSFQYADLVLLAFIAAFIALRLRSMLGKGGGFDPREVWKQATREGTADKVSLFPERSAKEAPLDLDAGLHGEQELSGPVSEGLRAIKVRDANFSTNEFLAGAKLAFEWVVQAFAKGEKDKLRSLLSDERYTHFSDEIDARTQEEVQHEATLVSVLATDITDAEMIGSRAHITVQFTSEQVHVGRDKNKNLVSGDPSVIEKVVDVWTFERDTNSRDPNWKITAT